MAKTSSSTAGCKGSISGRKLRFHMLCGTAKKREGGLKRLFIAYTILRKESKNESITLPDFKQYYKSTVVKKV